MLYRPTVNCPVQTVVFISRGSKRLQLSVVRQPRFCPPTLGTNISSPSPPSRSSTTRSGLRRSLSTITATARVLSNIPPTRMWLYCKSQAKVCTVCSGLAVSPDTIDSFVRGRCQIILLIIGPTVVSLLHLRLGGMAALNSQMVTEF